MTKKNSASANMAFSRTTFENENTSPMHRSVFVGDTFLAPCFPDVGAGAGAGA